MAHSTALSGCWTRSERAQRGTKVRRTSIDHPWWALPSPTSGPRRSVEHDRWCGHRTSSEAEGAILLRQGDPPRRVMGCGLASAFRNLRGTVSNRECLLANIALECSGAISAELSRRKRVATRANFAHCATHGRAHALAVGFRSLMYATTCDIQLYDARLELVTCLAFCDVPACSR